MVIAIKLRTYLIISLLAVITACTQKKEDGLPGSLPELKNLTVYTGKQKPAFEVSLVPERSFGDTRQIFFKYIAHFDADSQGRVYIAQDSILIFNPDGTYLTSAGKKGSGPGEFQTIGNLKIKSERLYVYDAMLHRISIFNLDSLKYAYAFTLTEIKNEATNGHFFVRNNGQLILEYQDPWVPNIDRQMHLYIVDGKTGKLQEDKALLSFKVKNVFRIRDKKNIKQGEFSFSRTTLNTISSADELYSANTGKIFIKAYDRTGHYVRSFYYPFKNKPIDYDSYFGESDSHISQSSLPDFNFPKTWPAIKSMIMDDQDRIWLATITKADDTYTWWVLAKNGRLLAKFTWPRNRKLRHIKNGEAYALQKDEVTGADTIIRYKIHLNKKKDATK